MADPNEVSQFFAAYNPKTPVAVDPFPKLSDEVPPGHFLRPMFENYDKKVADWIKRAQLSIGGG